MTLGVGITLFVHVNVKVWWGKACFYILVQLLGLNGVNKEIKG